MSNDSTEEIAQGYKIKRNHKTTDIFSLEEANGIIPVYKLTCFPVKALAEPSKFLMKYGGIDFEDDNYEHDPKSLFERELQSCGNKEYNQSIAVARFFAKQVKLVGNDDLEDFEIDTIVDTVNDLRLAISLYYYEQDTVIKESKRKKLITETIPFYLERLDKISENNGGHLACKRLTWADMFFVSLLDYMNTMSGFDLVNKFENLALLERNVLTLPAIKDWTRTRRDSKDL